jgi:hypothetical protein
MPDETNQTSVRITNAQVYAEVMELKAIQIELVTEFRQIKDLPKQVNELREGMHEVREEVASMRWVPKVALGALGAGIGAFLTAIFGSLL